MNKMELRLSGNGGQGIILVSVILAEAAFLSGKQTAQSQSYGPEARGGLCKAETIISEEPIGFTKVTKPTFLLALAQQSADKYAKDLPEDCQVLVDSTVDVSAYLPAEQVISLPILETARDVLGKIQTANIVAAACINRILNICDDETLEKAVRMHIPKGTEKLNLKALKEGAKLVAENGKRKK